MNGRREHISVARVFGVLIMALSCQSCSPRYSYKETGVPNFVKSSERLERLFAKTKLVCFGRYALEVPAEAEVIPGDFDIEVVRGGAEVLTTRPAADVAKILKSNSTAEITYNGPGPVSESWQLRFSESEISKSVGLHFYITYVSKQGVTFILRDAVDQSATHATVVERQERHARNISLRNQDDVPKAAGYCFENGFMGDDRYDEQEMSNAGIYLPSFPDVTFSISSNKDAYSDYPKTEYESRWRKELSLLYRIDQAKKDQPGTYPSRTVLREGKRQVNHWYGEESLIRRTDGVHDFQWAFVGTPKDIANPSEFGVAMYTKVEHNTVGAARAASLSDDEAVALYDRLLSGMKFRVKVPGAPVGSFYFDTSKSEPGS